MSTTCLSKLGQIDLISIFSPYNAKITLVQRWLAVLLKNAMIFDFISCILKILHIWIKNSHLCAVKSLIIGSRNIFQRKAKLTTSRQEKDLGIWDHLTEEQMILFFLEWKKLGVKWLQWMNVVDGLADKVNLMMDVQC